MTDSNIIVPNDLLSQLRKAIPMGRSTYGQARINAQIQAIRLRKLLGSKLMRLPLGWIERIPGVSVTMLTADEIEKLTKRPAASGATDARKDGTYRIFVNESSSITHARFTISHELYHVITGPFENDLFGDFGHGDTDLHRRRVEQVADHFAANLLMPQSLVTKAWGYGIQGASQLADFFDVSEEAMRIRLKSVGLIRGLTKDMFYRAPFGAGRGSGWPRQPERNNEYNQPAYGASRSGSDDLTDDILPEDDQSFGGFPQMHCPGNIITVTEACQRLRVSRWTLYKLIHERQIKTFKLGSRRLIPESAVWELVDRLSDEEAA